MKRIRLDLDNMQAQSFATTADATAGPGSVFGYSGEFTCPTWEPSCVVSCQSSFAS
jgi:hypothetical protein